jgi:hypothetical protein
MKNSMRRIVLILLTLFVCVTPAQATITFVQQNSAAANGSAATITVALTGVGAGNLIVLFACHETVQDTITASDGTTSLTGLTRHDFVGGSGSGRFLYLLSANSGDKTYTVTFGSAAQFRKVFVWEYSYSGTAEFDQENSNESNGGTSSITSGNITTTGTDEVVLAGNWAYSASFPSDEQINGVAADNIDHDGNDGSSWDSIVTATFTGQATATRGTASWACLIASFKATGAAAVERRKVIVY